jgi:diguanylate cyclase (GGDEF)-like protein/PAS domain S-box-containing protein
LTSDVTDARVPARDHLERLEAIFRLAPLGIGIVDPQGRTIMSNDTLCRWLGYSAEELASMPWTEFTHPDDIAANLEQFELLNAGEIQTFTLEKRFIAKDGSLRWAQLSSSMVRDEVSGDPSYIIGIVEDINERKLLEQNLLAADEKYRLLVERVPAVVYIADIGAEGRWRYVSPKIEKMLGFAPQEWLDDPGLWLRQIHPDDRERALAPEDLAAAGSYQQSTSYRMLHRDGTVIHVRDDAMALGHVGEEPAWHGVLVDITREKLLETELGHQARHDPLTDLPNRTMFHELVASALHRADETSAEVAVLFVDLDRFKDVNDTFGHSYGDLVIAESARRIAASIRGSDHAARLGGDEFAILVEGADAAVLDTLASRVLTALTQHPMHLSGVMVTVGASLGIAAAGPGDDADTVLRNADLAMYQAKRLGGGVSVPYQPELHEAVVTRFRTQEALQRAVATDGIDVALQPIVDLTTMDVVALEALARWTDPELGPVSPAVFIPLAEQSGLIRDLGRRMLHRSCEDLATYRSETGSAAYVTINASPLQLDGTYLDDVEQALSGAGLEPSGLVVEVTEGVMLEPKARECLAELRSRGVRVAIDDFGTGYSSLSYIRDLPVDIVKVDRSFLRPGPQGANDQPVLRAIVDLVNSLGLVSLLEGVENTHDLATARVTGADLAQGYLFGRPALLDDLLSAQSSRQVS